MTTEQDVRKAAWIVVDCFRAQPDRAPIPADLRATLERLAGVLFITELDEDDDVDDVAPPAPRPLPPPVTFTVPPSGRVIVGCSADGQRMEVRPVSDETCPDGGTCHHGCVADRCWRVTHAGPLSGVYPDDRWPTEIRLYRGRDAIDAEGHPVT